MKNKKYTIADMAELIAKQEKKFATNPRALKKLAQAKQMLMQTNDAKRSNSGGNKFEEGGSPDDLNRYMDYWKSMGWELPPYNPNALPEEQRSGYMQKYFNELKTKVDNALFNTDREVSSENTTYNPAMDEFGNNNSRLKDFNRNIQIENNNLNAINSSNAYFNREIANRDNIEFPVGIPDITRKQQREIRRNAAPDRPYPPTLDILNKEVKSGERLNAQNDRFLNRDAQRETRGAEKSMGIKTKAGKRIDTIKEEFKNNPNLATGIFQGAAMIGDFANQMSAIKDMKEPNKVALAPQARLNKNMDTSAYRNDANRAFRTQNMIANNAPNQSVGNAMRGNIMGQYLNSLGQVNTAANNYRSQMENQEAGLNASINMQNAGIMNDFYSAKNQFANNKRMAKANAFSGLLGNAQLMAKDYRQQAFDKNVRYPMMSKWASAQSQAFLNS